MENMYIEKINNGKRKILKTIDKSIKNEMFIGINFFYSLMKKDNPDISDDLINNCLMSGKYKCKDNSIIFLRHDDT